MRRLLVVAFAVPAFAQSPVVRGTLLQPDGRTPAPGVLVESHRANGALVARALSGANGRFAIAGDTGVTELRALRIGYRPTMVRVRADTGGMVVLRLEAVNVSLASVKVSTDDQCNVRGDTGQPIARAWEMARTALATTTLTERRREVTATSLTYQSWRDDDGGAGHWQSASVRDVASARPFTSAPAAQLAAKGYAVKEGTDGVNYLGPDAESLISDEFAAAHCFRLVPANAEHPKAVGVAFRPIRSRSNIVDIAGTFWLDAASGALEVLDYRYTDVPPDLQRANAGGRIEFARLASGDWLVNRWSIRLVTVLEHNVVARAIAGSGNARFVQERDEGKVVSAISGGEVLAAKVDGAEAYAADATTWHAVVVHETGAAGWQDATLEVPQRGVFALTDENGRFDLPRAPSEPGDALLSTAASRVLGLPAQRVRVSLRAGATDSLRVRRDEELLRERCGASAIARQGTAVFGVRQSGTGRSLDKDTIWVRWLSPADASRGKKVEDQEAHRVVTDTYGRWYVCGIPREATVMFSRAEEPDRKDTNVVRKTLDRGALLMDVDLAWPLAGSP